MDELLIYENVIRLNPLFRGMSREEIVRAAALLGGKTADFKKGDLLHQPWTPFSRFGLVLSGSVQACSDDLDGNRMIMADVNPGTTFGESLCWLGIADSPVYVYAASDCAVLWLSPDLLYSGSTDGTALDLQKRFTALLAARTLSMNSRIQILSKLSIREKVTVYLCDRAAASASDTVTVPLSREDMATYIGTNRAALSRELARMKRDGLIDYRKNTFVLKKQQKNE